MLDIIIDTLVDVLKLIPFLFLTFLLMEYLEHKIDNKKIVSSSKRVGPLLGSLLGVFPQCGFSVSATNLYATRIISMGTLISVYLSTSDEMLPIMLANKVGLGVIVKVLLIKFFVGVVSGFLIDFVFRKREAMSVESLCEHEHCHCDENLFFSALRHTFSIVLFILLFSLGLNFVFAYLGHDFLAGIFMKGTIFSHLLSSLVGLIPNCGASVMMTELYLNDTITFGACMSGLLTGCGVGSLILFRTNGFRDSLRVISITYLIGVVVGIIVDLTFLM